VVLEAKLRTLKTVADPDVLRALESRLAGLNAASQRRWGTLTPHEMLCHLGDACEMVLRTRPRERPLPRRARPVVKFLGLSMPLRWPRGIATNPAHDPRSRGTKPGEFNKDRERVVATLRAIAAAKPETLEPMHGNFGVMSTRDWQRWAYKHTDHHLRQFGL
jgi:hypothetical protein